MPKSDLARLIDDDEDLVPQNGLPAWEAHNPSGWHALQTPKGLAVVHLDGDRATGMVRFPDRTIVPIPPGAAREVFSRAESILREGPSGWSLLELDVLDPDADKPKPAPAPQAAEDGPWEAPVRTGQKGAFPWKFR